MHDKTLRDIERHQVQQANFEAQLQSLEQPAQGIDWWSFALGFLFSLICVFVFFVVVSKISPNQPQEPKVKWDSAYKHVPKGTK